MTKHEKVMRRLMSGASDTDFPFTDLCNVLRRLGFDLRVRGDHHIFTKDGVEEILNLQPKGMLAKPYQVKQVRRILIKYSLTDDE